MDLEWLSGIFSALEERGVPRPVTRILSWLIVIGISTWMLSLGWDFLARVGGAITSILPDSPMPDGLVQAILGIGLGIIVAVPMAFLARRADRISRGRQEARDVGLVTQITESIQAMLAGNTIVGQPEPPADSLNRMLVQGRRQDDLEIHKSIVPWRVWYPLHFFNGSDAPVDIVGYNFNLLLNDSETVRITWRAPEPEASNGILLHPNIEVWEAYTIEAGAPYTLTVPISRRNMGDMPIGINPLWGARGSIYLRCNGVEQRIPFNFDSDKYQLGNSDWAVWLTQ